MWYKVHQDTQLYRELLQCFLSLGYVLTRKNLLHYKYTDFVHFLLSVIFNFLCSLGMIKQAFHITGTVQEFILTDSAINDVYAKNCIFNKC